MAKVKNLYRGTFNYSHELRILYCYAYSERSAWLIMCRRLAKRHDVSPSVVMGKFDGSAPNYSIELELEVKEV